MNSRFMRVHDEFGQEYVINVDSVSWISADTCNVCMSGTHCQGNGILRLRPKDIQRLLVMTGVDHGTD
jgi:hypothetical protein